MRNYTNSTKSDKRWFGLGTRKTKKINKPKYYVPFGGIRL